MRRFVKLASFLALSLVLAALLPSCALSPAQRSQAQLELDRGHAAHEITDAQYAAASEALQTGWGGIDWVSLGSVGLRILLGVLGVGGAAAAGTTGFHVAKTRAMIRHAKAVTAHNASHPAAQVKLA
jgi:hypothetical protein